MKPFRLLPCLLCLVLTGVPAASQEDPAVSEQQAQVDGLAWLAGTWRGEVGWTHESARSPYEVTYSTPEGGFVLGMSKSFDESGQANYFEIQRIAVHEQGWQRWVVMTTYPEVAGEPVAFQLATADPEQQRAVFRRPMTTGWPREVQFERVDERLVVRILGNGRRAEVIELRMELARQR
jgi:Domain of unknown function (DUF6265)